MGKYVSISSHCMCIIPMVNYFYNFFRLPFQIMFYDWCILVVYFFNPSTLVQKLGLVSSLEYRLLYYNRYIC
jgi:hypothetical protein